jgi:hypothetical protein
VSTFLFGVTLVQVYSFAVSEYKADRILKSFVALVW